MARNKSDDVSSTGPGSGFSELQDPGRDLGAVLRVLVALTLVGLSTVFAVQNSESVDVEFLTWEFSLPLVLLLVASAIIGIVLFEMIRFLRRRRSSS